MSAPPCADSAIYNPKYTTPSRLYPTNSPSGLPYGPANNGYTGQSFDCAQRQQIASQQRESQRRFDALARKYRM